MAKTLCEGLDLRIPFPQLQEMSSDATTQSAKKAWLRVAEIYGSSGFVRQDTLVLTLVLCHWAASAGRTGMKSSVFPSGFV